MRKLNQKGFGGVESLLIVIIVLLVGFIGYYVYHAQGSTSKDLNITQPATVNKPAGMKVTLKNGGQAFVSLTLPAGWSQDPQYAANYPDASCSVTATNTLTPLDKGTVTPTALLKSNNKPDVLYDVVRQPDTKSLKDYFLDDLYQGYDDIHTFTNMIINGNPAVLYNGGSVANGTNYKQQYYLIAHNGYVACLRWSYYDRGTSTSEHPHDFSNYMDDVKAMAESVKFSD